MDKLLLQASREVELDESQDLLDIANALVEERGLRSPDTAAPAANRAESPRVHLQVFPRTHTHVSEVFKTINRVHFRREVIPRDQKFQPR